MKKDSSVSDDMYNQQVKKFCFEYYLIWLVTGELDFFKKSIYAYTLLKEQIETNGYSQN